MQHAALSDPLTGLANRRMLMSMADYEIARHHRADARFAVVMLDLDGFKLVNDRYGHAAGDQMLCDVGAALTRVLRSQDTIARLGGDEFCVIAPETENPRALAEKIADRSLTGGQRLRIAAAPASGCRSSPRTERRSSCCCGPLTTGCSRPSAGVRRRRATSRLSTCQWRSLHRRLR